MRMRMLLHPSAGRTIDPCRKCGANRAAGKLVHGLCLNCRPVRKNEQRRPPVRTR